MTQLLDTNVILYFLAGNLTLEEKSYFVSVITELELLSYPSLDQDMEKKIHDFLEQVEIINLTPDIIKATIEIRRKHKLKLPDSIILGTAKVFNLEILTNDRQIIKLPGIRCRELELSSTSK